MNVLVMGIGNLLLQDEGAGVRVIEELEKKYEMPDGVELLDGGTAGIELLQYIDNRDVLILVDVINTGSAAGTISRFEGEDVPAFFQKKISPHQLGISDLLATARLTGSVPNKIVLLGVDPQSIDTGLELTEVVAGKISVLAGLVAEELRSLGLVVEPRSL
jgi:hydrogenase maturation protease